MSGDTLDLTVHGDPVRCRAASAELAAQGRALRDAEAGLDSALQNAQKAWAGEASEAFRRFASGVLDETAEVRQKSVLLSEELSTFANELGCVQTQMDRARDVALAARLRVEGDLIYAPLPPHPAADMAPTQPFGAPPQWTNPYHECWGIVVYGRDRERLAHEAIQDVAARVRALPFLEHWLAKFGLQPASTNAVGLSLWASNAGLFGAGTVAGRAVHVAHGAFMPAIGFGRVAGTELPRWERFRYGLSSSNWRHLPNHEVPFRQWTKAGKALNVAGAVVSGGTAAWGQLQADLDDPSLNAGEIAARTVTVGATTGLGAYGGAVLGGQIGGAIGTAICPGIGTVVGGALGGAVGGLIGSEVGERLGNQIIGAPEDLVDGAKDIVNGIKKVKFW